MSFNKINLWPKSSKNVLKNDLINFIKKIHQIDVIVQYENKYTAGVI